MISPVFWDGLSLELKHMPAHTIQQTSALFQRTGCIKGLNRKQSMPLFLGFSKMKDAFMWKMLTVEQEHFVWRTRRGRPGYSAWLYLYEVTELIWVEECPTYSHVCPRFTIEEVWWLTNISAVPLICSGGIQTVLSCFTFTRNCICSHCWLCWKMAGCYCDNAVCETPIRARITAEPAAA